MPRKTGIPITGSVLKWATEDAALTESELATALRVTSEEVRRWEREEARPSQAQLRRLAHVLRRPVAFFFLPKPPEIPAVATEFRKAPGLVRKGLNREEARWLRLARRL